MTLRWHEQTGDYNWTNCTERCIELHLVLQSFTNNPAAASDYDLHGKKEAEFISYLHAERSDGEQKQTIKGLLIHSKREQSSD